MNVTSRRETRRSKIDSHEICLRMELRSILFFLAGVWRSVWEWLLKRFFGSVVFQNNTWSSTSLLRTTPSWTKSLREISIGFHVTVRSWAMPVKSLPEDSIVHTVVNRVLTGCIFSIRVSTTDDENIANARWCNQVGNIACRWSGGGRKQHACFLVASSTDSSQLSFYVAPRRHLIWQRVRKRPEYFTWNASALRVCWWHMRSISNEKIIIWVHGGLIGFLFIEGDFGRRGCRFLWDVRFAWMIISFFF